MQNAEPLPARLGHYRIDACLSRGKTGPTYRAYEESLDRTVVLKVLSPEGTARPDSVEQFHAKAQSAGAVDHPGVARIYWVSTDTSQPFFAREFVDGQSLQDRLTVRGRLEPAEALRIAEASLEGLAAIHRQKLLHGNLKPSNILLEESSGRVVLTDIGLGWDPERRETTDPEALPYQAPEQRSGHPLDDGADLYALGAILCESLIGHPPPSAIEETPLPGGIDRPLAPVLRKLLAVDPRRRYPDAATALAAVRTLRRGGAAGRRLSPRQAPAVNGPLLVGLLLGCAASVLLVLAGLGLGIWYWVNSFSPGSAPLSSTVPLEETDAEDSQENAAPEHPPMADKVPLADRDEPQPVAVPTPKRRSPRPLPPELVPLAKLAPTLTNSINMKLARIPSGRFLMGSHEPLETLDRDIDHPYKDFADELPQHPVFLSQHFYMGVYEVTQEKFEKVMGAKPSRDSARAQVNKEEAGPDTRRFPVEGVTWFDAVEFCRRLSAMPAERARGRVYRLPTEAEWEYACRGDGHPPTRYYFGSRASQISRYGWFSSDGRTHRSRTHRVGELLPNAFGLHDMIGNVREWCQDVYSPTYYQERTAVDPRGPAETSPVVARVQRIGPRSSQRYSQESAPGIGAGFRVVFTATRPEPSE